MLKRLTLIALLMTGILLPAGASVADERPPAKRPSITLTLPATGMADVPIAFRVGTTPGARATVALQVKTSTGFVTQKRVVLDARGRATGTLVSKKAAERIYRAVLLSEKGKPVAASAPARVTWTPLQHTVSLSCGRTSAPIGVDVPCTITVTPAVRLEGIVAYLQVMGRTEWVLVEATRVPASGILKTDVEGYAAGIGAYRVLLVRDDLIQAESTVTSISYS